MRQYIRILEVPFYLLVIALACLERGNPGVAVGVYQTSGSNANEIIEQIEGILEEAKADFPKGMDYVIPFNSKDFLDASRECANIKIIIIISFHNIKQLC